MRSGNGTLSHCAPPLRCVSIYPHVPIQKRLYMPTSVRLSLYWPPIKFFTPMVWLTVNSGASRFTGRRCCFVLMYVWPGQKRKPTLNSVVRKRSTYSGTALPASSTFELVIFSKTRSPFGRLLSAFIEALNDKPQSVSYMNPSFWRL